MASNRIPSPAVFEKWSGLQSQLVFLANLNHCCDLSCLYNYLNFKIVWTAAVFVLIELSAEKHHHIKRLHGLAQSCPLVERIFVFPIRFIAGNITQSGINPCSACLKLSNKITQVSTARLPFLPGNFLKDIYS